MEGCVFCKKMENVFFVKKSGKWEVFCKKWTFSQRNVHYLQYQYFLFYILLIWGVRRLRTQRTLLPTGLDSNYAPLPYWRRSSKNVLDEK